MFKYSKYSSFFKSSGSLTKPKKTEADYEEIGPALKKKENQNTNAGKLCDLCGSHAATVKCDKCNNQSFCFSCDDMYHKHPKRASHTRKAVDKRTVDRGPQRPPLPPKADGILSPPPQPPPRKNKRSGLFNVEHGGFIGPKRRSSVGGDMLLNRAPFMGTGSSDESQSTMRSYNMEGRPLPPPPGGVKSLMTRTGSAGNLVQIDGRQQMELRNLSNGNAHEIQSNNADISSNQMGHNRKLSLQQFPFTHADKNSSVNDSGQVNAEQPPKIPQKMRSQSISDDQWKKTILAAKGSEVDGQMLPKQQYNSLGFPFPAAPKRGMVSSASISNLNTANPHMQPGLQQMSMMPYNPNAIWMPPCPQCHPQAFHHHHSHTNPGMKRTTSNVSMSMNSENSYPWSLPPHVHHHAPMPVYPGYFQGYQQGMSRNGSSMSIPDSVNSFGKTSFSPAPSSRSKKSHKSKSYFAATRSRGQSRRGSSNDSISSYESDENVTFERQRPQRTGSLSWQCSHCTYMNSGHTQICGMCSKSSNEPEARNKKYIDKYIKPFPTEPFERQLSDLDNNQRHKSNRERYRERSRRASSTKSSIRTRKKSRQRDSIDSNSCSPSDSPPEKIEKQLSVLRIQKPSLTGEYDGVPSSRNRYRNKRKEEKHKLRKRSQSAHGRTESPVRERFSKHSLTSSGSELSNEVFSRSPSPEDINEQRISSIEATILASIISNQMSRGNKDKNISLSPNKLDNINTDDLYTKVIKSRLAIEGGSVTIQNEQKSENEDDKIHHPENDKGIDINLDDDILSHDKIETLSVSIEGDGDIKYIDDMDDIEVENIMSGQISNTSDDFVENNSPKSEHDVSTDANYHLEKNTQSIMEPDEPVSESISVPKTEVMEEVRNIPYNSINTVSPTSISSSDVCFYSPTNSPVRGVASQKGPSHMDRGYETDYYGDEDLVTALESLENSEDESSSSYGPSSSADSIHSSLEQLSFDEKFESKNVPTKQPNSETESFASRLLTISKSISEQAISAKMHIPLLNKISSKQPDIVEEEKTVKKQTMKEQGMQLIQYFREAEEKCYDPEEVSIAMTQVEGGNPIEWLEENWNAMIDTVKTLATNYGVGKESNDIGNVTELEARKALRVHKGDVWAAVTECVQQRQKNYIEITSKGNFKSEDILKALEVAYGNVAEAFLKLTQVNHIGKFLINMWGSKSTNSGEEILSQAIVEENRDDLEDEENSVNGSEKEEHEEFNQMDQDESDIYANDSETDASITDDESDAFETDIGSVKEDPPVQLLPINKIKTVKGSEQQKEKQTIQVMPKLKKSDLDKISYKAAFVMKNLKTKVQSEAERSKQNISEESNSKLETVDVRNIEKKSSPAKSIPANSKISPSTDAPKSTVKPNEIKESQIKCGVSKAKIVLETSSSTVIPEESISNVMKAVSKSEAAPESSTSMVKIHQQLDKTGTVPGKESSIVSDSKGSIRKKSMVKKDISDVAVVKKIQGNNKNTITAKSTKTSTSDIKETSEISDYNEGNNFSSSDITQDSKSHIGVEGSKDNTSSRKVRKNKTSESINKVATDSTIMPVSIASTSSALVAVNESINKTNPVPKDQTIAIEKDVKDSEINKDIEINKEKEDTSDVTIKTEKVKAEIKESEGEQQAQSGKDDIKPVFQVKKATLIVGKAVAKAMAREAVVKEGRITPRSDSQSPRNTLSDESSDEIDESEDISLSEIESTEGDQIEEDIHSESDVSYGHSPTMENRALKSKSTIPSAVESFSGPIFIPSSIPAQTIPPKLSNQKDGKVKSKIRQIESESSKPSISTKEQTQDIKLEASSSTQFATGNQFYKEESGITVEKLSATPDLPSRPTSLSPNVAGRGISKSPATDENSQMKPNRLVESRSGGSTMESPEESDEELDDSNMNSADIDAEFQKVQKINEYITQQLEDQEKRDSDDDPKETEKSEAVAKTEPQTTQEDDQLIFERTVRRLLAEGHASTYERAEIAAHLVSLSFDEYDSVLAAEECDSIYSAIRFLRQECELCAEPYPVGKMVSMLHCTHRCCNQCAQNYFTFQIKAKNIRELRCPFCNEPDLDSNEEVAGEYFNNLDILLKGIIDEETHELFQRKIRDLTLMKEPNFRWCNKCSSGFIANPRARKLVCPDCKEVTCAHCKKVWELQHEGISCDDYAKWKEENDPESQAKGVEKHLAECGIKCPQCHFTYALAKGGCMHFTCNECKYEFCSGCSQPFKQGAKCNVGPYCERLGLHAHHPRNCLFYLRDKEPTQLQELLKEHDIPFNIDPIYDGPVKGTCRVQEQKETIEGLIDDYCGRVVQKGHAGLCRLHYIEYLVETINKNALDPVTIFDEADLRVCLRRNGKTVPVRRWESEKLYRKKLIKLIQEQLPLS